MMFLSGVSGLGAFDADYVREQMALRTQQQKAQVQQGVAYSAAQLDPRIQWAQEEAQRVAIRDRVAAQVAAAEASRKSGGTMLLVGGLAAAALAFVALKG
jgi:hypothetical protein